MESRHLTIRTITNQYYDIEIPENQTIQDLKVRIHDITGLKQYDQLIFNNGIPIFSENMQISNLESDIINLMTKLKGGADIIVKTINGKVMKIEVDLEKDTLLNLKKKICEHDKFKPEYQKLIFQGQTLMDDKKLLKSYGIVPGITVNVIYQMIG